MNTYKYTEINKNLERITLNGLEEINVGKLSPLFYYEKFKKNDKSRFKTKIMNYLSIIVNSLTIFSKVDFSSLTENQVVLFYSYGISLRNDYLDMISYVTKDNFRFKILTESSYKIIRRKPRFGFDVLIIIPKLLQWNNKLIECGIPKEDLPLFLKNLVVGFYWLNYLKKNKVNIMKIKGLVTFFDATLKENILTQYLNFLGIKTATLQHGHYRFDRNNEEILKHVNLAFEGFVSQEIWLWGNFQKLEFLNAMINKKRLRLVGCPFFVPKLLPIPYNSVRTLGIAADGGLVSEFMRKLIEISIVFAKKYKYKIIYKPHPGEDFRKYKDNFKISDDFLQVSYDSIIEFSNSVEFVLCINTSAFLQFVMMDKPIFRFDIDRKYDAYPNIKSNRFSSFETLDKLYIDNQKSIDLESFKKEINSYYNTNLGYKIAIEEFFYEK